MRRRARGLLVPGPAERLGLGPPFARTDAGVSPGGGAGSSPDAPTDPDPSPTADGPGEAEAAKPERPTPADDAKSGMKSSPS